MAPLLRFQRKRKTGVSGDLHGGHMIHLDGDLQGHRFELRRQGGKVGQALDLSTRPANPAQVQLPQNSPMR
ncbi:hypothetical protein GCM10016234_25720 [Tianweitania populi]|uniref:Uncharacterized protein n=1 Tax=Tianweitania populi TaxID=1607949 RepID=A0A8J3DVJ4_9HYPH|nr:hypothetical protein GCM10016234_25720 [Tianweitania populi]